MHMYRVDDVTCTPCGHGLRYTLKVKLFRGKSACVWKGKKHKVPSVFPWERDGDVPVARSDSSSESADSDISDSPRSSGGEAEALAATPSTTKPDPEAAQEWPKCLRPGHPATGTALPEGIDVCKLVSERNRINRQHWWVARFSGPKEMGDS